MSQHNPYLASLLEVLRPSSHHAAEQEEEDIPPPPPPLPRGLSEQEETARMVQIYLELGIEPPQGIVGGQLWSFLQRDLKNHKQRDDAILADLENQIKRFQELDQRRIQEEKYIQEKINLLQENKRFSRAIESSSQAQKQVWTIDDILELLQHLALGKEAFREQLIQKPPHERGGIKRSRVQ